VRWRLVAQARADQAEACRALVESEVVIWPLEGACFEDALRILSRPEAHRIAAGLAGVRDPERIEKRLREYLRIRRAPGIWDQAKRAFATFTLDSRAATNEIAIEAGLRPVDIMVEWMTYEGAVDLYLMDKLWTERAALPEGSKDLPAGFFPLESPRPAGARGISIREAGSDCVVIDLFGATVREEWVRARGVALMPQGEAKVPWASNYNYYRDVIRDKNSASEVLDFVLVRSDDGFGVDYREWMAEYKAGGERVPWATLLATQGALAVGATVEKKGEASAPAEDGAAKRPAHGKSEPAGAGEEAGADEAR
jgi:hypothetical protein